MKILCISGYAAWEKVPYGEMPSNHLFGIHEMIDHYEHSGESVRGFIRSDVLGGGYVDFYLWNGGKKNIAKQTIELLKLSRDYDIIYDMLNRCSIFLGIFRRFGLLKSKLVTIMHHPPYKTQLNIADSDAYIFFDAEYKKLAEENKPKKVSRYFVNEWRPDYKWYQTVPEEEQSEDISVFYIDNGKSRRDRDTLIKAADIANVRVDYAGDANGTEGWARPYKVDLKDDIAQLKKLRKYKAIIIPIQKSEKEKIGPLGITSYLDAIALGLPVIVSDNACFAGEIKRLGSGIVYTTGEYEELAQALKRLQADENFYEECVQNINRAKYPNISEYSNTLVAIVKALF